VKRVLHVGKFYPPVSGGMERVVQALCRASSGLVENRVLVMNTSAATIEDDVEGVRVTRVGTVGAAGSVTIAPAFTQHLRRAAADLIVLHEPNPWALLSYALVRPPSPLAVWYHSDVVGIPCSTGCSMRRSHALHIRARSASSCRRRRSPNMPAHWNPINREFA